MGDKRLFLIDATAFCYRAFYALQGLSTSFGQPTNAIYGFLNILNKILKEKKPDYLAVCFDVSRETFRTKKYEQYKIQRPPMPDGLSSQIPLIKELVSAYGINIFEKEGFEADDIIATLSRKAKQKGISVTIVSSDKDILQLVDDSTVVLSPYKDEGVLYDSRRVEERFGVGPDKVADIIALMGDDVDNIPGVPGIGEKTATNLISEFSSLDNLLKNIDKVKQDKLRNSIRENIEKINLNKELVELRKDVDIDFNLEKIGIGEPDTKELFRLFKHLEFKKMLRDLAQPEEKPLDFKAAEIEESALKDSLGTEGELIIYGGSFDNMFFCAKNKIFQVSGPGDILRSVLKDSNVKKLSHDLKKNKISLAKEGIVLGGLYFDTMIAAYLANPSKSEYSLSDVALDYLSEALSNKEIEPIKAVDLIRRLKPKLEQELEEKKLSGLFAEVEMPLCEVLAEMELNGIKIDTEALDTLSRDLEKRLIKLIEEIYALSGTQFNINSPKQLREVLFEKLKLPVIKRSKTGPSTDEEVLRALADKHKLPKLLLEYRQLTKLKNTYIDALPLLIDKKTGKIHTTFNQTGTETGRLSSSNPNLQNIPIKTDIGRKIRSAIIASEKNRYLLSCDYSQIELRILAHLSKDEHLISAFLKEKDIHKATASLIYGIEEKDVSEEMRETAKRVNFGIVYGLTSYGLSRDLGIPVDEAQNFIDAYFMRYPGVKVYIEEEIKKAEKDGFVTTILGRRRYITEIRNKNMAIRQFAQRQAVNTPIQGSASDLIKLAMLAIHKDLCSRELGTQMILQIHDELVFDVPKQELDDVVELVRDRMENVLKLEVPIKVDIKKGKNWLELEPV